MEFDVLKRPDSAVVHIHLNPQEEILSEAGAMVAMSGHMEADTTLRQGKGGGIMGGLKRMMGGESIFISRFRSGNQAAEVYLAPKLMGDVIHHLLVGDTEGLVVQSTSYLASTGGVDVDLGFQGLKSFFSGEAIFWLNISGQGVVFLNSFGGIYEVDVDGTYVVDTGHIVAFEKSLNFKITKANTSLLNAIFGGEGLVMTFEGRGKLYCQTHNAGSFGQLVGSRLPPRNA
ncbi:MAG: TIGR00266 family protein [Prochlorothrix sp.]|nr:TIGR00266 family protein [Prochlorothrix sp.]